LLFASGTIKGVVKDAQTGEGLPGANVVIKSIYLGTSTYISGEYVLAGVPEGSQVLTISFLGYQEQNITVNIVDGKTETIDISLQQMSVQGEEVTVTAQVLGQRAAINQQLAANTVMNVVSGKKIQELPDANAAESIGRLPGVSLKRSGGEASQVVVRGLSPKYNNVMIEGIKMSSTNDFDRSVDLSLVQSESLSGIEVSKSLRADMDADALGGTINLRLQPAREGFKAGGTTELGYAHITDDYRNYKLGGHISNRFFNNKIGISLKASAEQKQLPSHQFSGGYGSLELDQVLDDEGNIIESSYYCLTNSATLT
jgi:outer membrane cobalamin receptor